MGRNDNADESEVVKQAQIESANQILVEQDLPKHNSSIEASQGESKDSVLQSIPASSPRRKNSDMVHGMDGIGTKTSTRSIVPISHMMAQQEKFQQQMQKQKKQNVSKRDIHAPKLDMAMVKGVQEIPMTGDSIIDNGGHTPIKHNYATNFAKEDKIKQVDFSKEEHDGGKNAKQQKKRIRKDQGKNGNQINSQRSSFSDPNSDQTLRFNQLSQHSLALHQLNTDTEQNMNQDLLNMDPTIVSNRGTTLNMESNQNKPPHYAPLKPYLLGTIDGVPLLSQLDESGRPVQSSLLAVQGTDKNRTILMKNEQTRSKGKISPSPERNFPKSPNETFVNAINNMNETGETSQAFAPLQGKTLQFNNSGHATTKNKNSSQINQNPFKAVQQQQSTQQTISSPRISKPIVLVTKKSEKSSPFMRSNDSPLKGFKERSPSKKKPHKKRLRDETEDPGDPPMTIGSLEKNGDDPGTQQEQREIKRFSKPNTKDDQMKKSKDFIIVKSGQSTPNISPIDPLQRNKEVDDVTTKHLIVQGRAPQDMMILQQLMLDTDQSQTDGEGPTEMQVDRMAAYHINPDISMLKNVGTTYTPDETQSDSMQSVRSRVQVVIHAARREKDEINKQIIHNQSQKYRTPQRQRTLERDRTQTLMLPYEGTGTHRTLQQHDQFLKTDKKQSTRNITPGAGSQTMPVISELHKRRHSTDVNPLNTFKHSGDCNMYAKRTSLPHQHIVYPRRPNETVFFRDHRDGSEKKVDIPKSLYYTNGYMPKLADLRDALKSNTIFHSRYNAELDDPGLRKYFKHAIQPTLEEKKQVATKGCIDETFENQDLLKFIIPQHQYEADEWKREVDARKAYIANLGSFKQQQVTDKKLTSSNIDKAEKLKIIAAKYEPKKVTFKAHQNPHKFKHTVKTIEQTMNGTAPKDHPDYKLMHWVAQQRKAEKYLPESLFDIPDEFRERIYNIIDEENRKMQANDNDFQKFDRLKKQIENNVDNGFSYKEAFAEMSKTKKSLTVNKQSTQNTLISDQDDQDQDPENSDGVRESLKVSSIMKSTIRNLLPGSEPSLDMNAVHYSTIGMDRGTPELTETRIRPDPSFVPVSTKRPKAIKQFKPCKDRIDLNMLRLEKAERLAKSQNKDIIAQIQENRVVAKVFKDNGLGSPIMEATEKDEMEKMNDSILRDSTHLNVYADESKMVSDLRSPNNELNRTHHEHLRKSKDQPLMYKSIDKGQISVENEEASSEVPNSRRTDNEKQDLTKDIAQDVRKSMVRDTSVVQIHKGEPIMMTDKSVQQLGLHRNVHATSNPNILFAGQVVTTQPSAVFLSNSPSNNQITSTTCQNQVPGITSRIQVTAIEQSVQRIYRPPLGKQSCNHCIGKVAKEYEEQQKYMPVQSIAGTTKAETSAGGQDLVSHSILKSQRTGRFSENTANMTLAEQSKYTKYVIQGILKECDITDKIIRKESKQTLTDLNKKQRGLEDDIEQWDHILYDIDEAQQAGECPLWNDVKEMKGIEKGTAEQIIKDIKWIQKREDVVAMTEMIKWDMKNRNFFKPEDFKFNDDIHMFMLKKNADYRKMINEPKVKNPATITLKKVVH